MAGKRCRLQPAGILSVIVLFLLMLPFAQAQGQEGRCRKVVYRIAGEITGPMQLPSDVALGHDGRVYVLDGTADVLRIYGRTGEEMSSLGGAGVLKSPLGLDVNDHGDVVVADSGNHRLALFPAGHKTPDYLSLPQPDQGRPSDPTDVHFGRDGEFVVVDNDNHRLLALDATGKLLWARGRMGRNEGEFRFPFMLDADNGGNLFVVEVINTRVQVLTPQGQYRNFIGEWGIEPGQFYRPKGVAVNGSGEVFVSDSYLGVVQIFDRGGRFLGVVGNDHGNIRRFQTPVGMDSRQDLLAVVEMVNNRVLILEKQL